MNEFSYEMTWTLPEYVAYADAIEEFRIDGFRDSIISIYSPKTRDAVSNIIQLGQYVVSVSSIWGQK